MKNWIYILSFISFFSCVEEIEFTPQEDIGTLVIDGLLSTSEDSSFIYLLRTSELKDQVFPAEEGAKIILFDQKGNHEEYLDLTGGKYYLSKNKIQIKIGDTYHIEVTTRSGEKYISDPETILPAPEIDSLNFNFSIEEIVERENRVLERSFFNLYVDGQIPASSDNTFLKWDVEHIYQVAELECSPLIPPKVCYVKRIINKNKITTLNGTEYRSGASFHIPVVHQELDYAFGLVASFYVSQKALTPSAYKYWDRVQQILKSGGSIFDTPPAPILGNVKCTTSPEKQVLGYFSAIDEKKKVILVTRGDFVDPFDELPLCGLNGNLPADIDFSICCNCLSLDNSSRTRPSYWP